MTATGTSVPGGRPAVPSLIGMVHLGPLPGAPRYSSLDAVTDRALEDARVLADVGFDAVMVENFGDVPFHADQVPPVTIAAMAVVVAEIRRSVDVPVGVNVLRNDSIGALSIAAATGASMIRVNVLAGTMFTDQGPVTGRAADVARLRGSLAPTVSVLADVFVKHAVPPAGSEIGLAATELWERAGADAVIVSGTGTGAPVDMPSLERVREAVPEAALLIGSGATPENVRDLASLADGLIVGSAIKPNGRIDVPVDAHLAETFVSAVRNAGL